MESIGWFREKVRGCRGIQREGLDLAEVRRVGHGKHAKATRSRWSAGQMLEVEVNGK